MAARSIGGLSGRAVWVALGLLGCGGRSVAFEDGAEGGASSGREPAPTPTPTPAPALAPTSSTSALRPLPDLPSATPCDEITLSAEREWFSSGGTYGLAGPGLLAFSPGGERLATFGEAYSFRLTEFDVATGVRALHQPLDEIVFGRDRDWQVEVRGPDYGGGALRLLDLETETEVFGVDVEDRLLVAAVSDDARWVSALSCRAGKLVVSRRGATAQDARELTTDQPCEPSYYAESALLELVEKGAVALYAPEWGDALTRVDFERGTLETVSLHAPSAWGQGVYALALAPDETLAVSAGASDVRFWRYPEFEPIFEPLPVATGHSFKNCYVSPRGLAALAWSPDGSLVAVPGDDGTLTVRRTCDLEPLLTLKLEEPVVCALPDEPTPAGLAAFSPAGDRIAVWWAGVVGMFKLSTPRDP